MTKRILFIFLVVIMTLSVSNVFADTWTETFDDQTSGSYGSTAIEIGGRSWTRSDAGNFSYANSYAGSYGFTINDDKAGAHITTPVLASIGTVSFKYAYRSGNSTNVFVLQKSTNGTDFTDLDTHTLGESSEENYVDYSFEVNDASSTIYIRILSDNQNAHLFIDDFTVTDNPGGSTPVDLSVNFEANFTSGSAPLTVNFSDLTSGGTSPYTYEWNFGDSSATSADAEPIHIYTEAGTYTVSLYVLDSADPTAEATETKTAYITVSEAVEGTASDLFISEYTEPDGGLTKVIEVYNGTGDTVDLSNYALHKIGNGGTWDEYSFTLNGSLAHNDVYIVANTGSASSILAIADDTNNTLCGFNGDDAIGLFKNGSLIDCVGTDGADPGSGWDVAGVSNATADHTLVRKASVTGPQSNWATSAGTDASDSEWIVYDANTIDYFGSHTMTGSGTVPTELAVDFEADVTSGTTPLEVSFTDLTTGGTSPYTYEWNFGDGTATSSEVNPTHTYTTDGTYTVSLYVLDSADPTADATETKTAYITVSSVTYEGYYESITAVGGSALENQLHDLIDDNTNSSYDNARAEMYGYIDNIDNTVTCVYTGMEVNHSYTNTSAPSGINCEHTYPQSWIEDYALASEELYAKADVHHLFPTESSSNSSRSNLAFDYVNSVDNSFSEATGYTSYRGSNAEGVTVWEPADQHKGNVARAMFYMSVRYGMPLSNTTRDLNIDMVETLIEWNNLDPVDQAERDRNDGVQDFQGNRNPFVDHSEWVNAIWGGEPVYTVATPVMTPAGGTYESAQTVEIATSTDGASIYYTTDGSEPTTSSTQYTSAIAVNESMTIKAIATKTEWVNSAVATETYTINIIPDVAIYDIQYVTDPATSDISAYSGQTVNVTGLVSYTVSGGFYLTSPAGGAWNSVYVYTSDVTPAVGDQVSFRADVAEYNTLTELTNVVNYTLVSSNNTLPNPSVVATGSLGEAYESCLVTVENVTTETEASSGAFDVNDGSGAIEVDDKFYTIDPQPILGTVYTSITGLYLYPYNHYELDPRSADDVVVGTVPNVGPVVSNVSQSPTQVLANDLVTISADVVDNDGTLASVNLKWGTATGNYTTTTPMTGAGTFTADIPGQSLATTIYYVIEATDDESETTTTNERNYTVVEEGAGFGVVILSELCDPRLNYDVNRFVEITNVGTAAVDLTGWTIDAIANDGVDVDFTWTLSGSIAAGQSLTCGDDGATAFTPNFAEADWSSSNSSWNGKTGDGANLYNNGVLIDTYIVGTSFENKTIVRNETVVTPSTTTNTDEWTATAVDNASDATPGTHVYGGTTPEIVETPQITPETGTFTSTQEVTITCATEGAAIYYTLDGTDPSGSSIEYTAAFNVTETTTVKAIAVKTDFTDSAIATSVITISAVPLVVETPVITPETGTYYSTQEVAITCATEGASIYYTLDGTDPSASSTEYTAAFNLETTTTVKAIAVKTDMTDSQIAEAVITIEELVLTPGMIISEYIEGSSNNKAVEIYNGTGAEVDLTNYNVQKGSNGGDWSTTCDMQGTLAAGEVFVIGNASADAAILQQADTTSSVTYFNGNDAIGLFYMDVLIDVFGTTDGSSDANFDVAGVTGAAANYTLVRKFSVTEGTTDWTASAGTDASSSQWLLFATDTFDYIGSHTDISEMVATPVISPDGGVFETSQEVTITCETADATIYYTIDGTDPTDGSTQYSAPFTLTASATVKAIAVKANMTDSAIATAEFAQVAFNDVATIAELRTGLTDGTIYRLTGQAVITYQQSNRNQKYIQDATAGILIDDNDGVITTIYNQYDGISNIQGTLSTYGGVMQFKPVTDTGNATSTGNTVSPIVVTLDELNTNYETYESRLIQVQDVTFVETGTFAQSSNYTLTDGTNNLVFRTNFSEADYLGTDISAMNLYVTGLAAEYNGTAQIFARTSADMVEQSNYDDGFNVSKTTMSFESEVGLVSESQSYILYFQDIEIAEVIATGDFQIKDPNSGNWGTSFESEMYEEELTVEVRFNATNAGQVSGTITHSDLMESYEPVEIALTGLANEVLPTAIYDIQYTEDASGDSPYSGQEVIVQGIVSYVKTGGQFYLTSAEGGAWNGIYVYDETQTVAVGDQVNFRASVVEYNNLTELTSVSDLTVISSENALPEPVVITTAELASNEAYESVLARIENVTVTDGVDNYDQWDVSDGSGACQIDDNFGYDYLPEPVIGDAFVSITGIVGYAYGEYDLNPRSDADVVPDTSVPEVVATPVILPATGTYNETQNVTITCSTEGATIYYSLDGNDPTTASSVYSEAFSVEATTTVKAYAVKAEMTDSPIAESVITIEEIVIPTGMIISEYIEGSSNNKAIEIYNGTGAEVDLTPYSVKLASNGGDWGNTYDMEGTLAAGAVFVIANSSADAGISDVQDVTSNVTYFNGDDAVGLFYNTTPIDVVGVQGTDPGSSWPVLDGATANYTLVRKMTVTEGTTDWALSAGTDAENSQWIVFPQDTFDYLGLHEEIVIGPSELAIPNVTITVVGSTITLSWDAVDDAVSYKVYMSDSPEISTEGDAAYHVTATSVDVSSADMMKFFKVEASTDAVESAKRN